MVVNTDTLSGSAHTCKWFSFRIPDSIVQPVYLRIHWAQPPVAGNRLFVDDLVVAQATELYPGGPFASLASGVTPTAPNDQWTITVTNSRAGEMQTYFDRFFDMSSQRLLLPSSGTYVLADSLIA
jgi:hypothetical protein